MHGGRRIELRRIHGLTALVFVLGCGAPSEPARVATSPESTTGAAPAMRSAEAADAPVAPVLGRIVGTARLEPQLLTPVELAPRPAEPARVRIALLTMAPGTTFSPPTGACQDALLFVREGELRAVGTGVAPPSTPATLYAGDAIRFGPDGDGLVQNLGERVARTVIAFVRADAEPSFTDAGPSQGEGCVGADRRDPLVVPIRSASVRSTPSHAAYGGALRARILLDEDGAGARHASLTVLEGDPDLTMPEHRHEGAAEVLFVEDGSGTMRIGDREVAVRPGLALYVPPGVLHDLRGDGTRPFRAIQVHTPAGPEQRLRVAR